MKKFKLGIIVFLIISIVAYCDDFYYYELLKKGAFYMQLKKFDQAIEYFQRAISIAPQNFEGYYYLGNVYFQEGKNKKAEENLEKAIEKFPEDPKDFNARINLAQCYYSIAFVFLVEDEVQKALKAFEKCINLAPNSLVGDLALKEKTKIENRMKTEGKMLK